MVKKPNIEKDFKNLVNKCKQIMKNKKNSLNKMYWNIGDQIYNFEERNDTKYRSSFRIKLAKELKIHQSTITYCVQFRNLYPKINDINILSSPNKELKWSWFLLLFPLSKTERKVIEEKLRGGKIDKYRDLVEEISTIKLRRMEKWKPSEKQKIERFKRIIDRAFDEITGLEPNEFASLNIVERENMVKELKIIWSHITDILVATGDATMGL